MNRRTFLTRMLGTTAAVAIAPKLFALPEAGPDAVINAAIADKYWQDAMRATHECAWHRLQRHMEEKGLAMRPERVYPAPSRMGDTVGDGVVLARQRTVSANLEYVQRVPALDVAIDALADGVLDDGLDHYGQLDLPWLHWEYVANRGPLRMIVVQPHIDENSAEWLYLCRFDVLGGASNAGRQFGARRRLRRSLRDWGRRRLSVRPLQD